MEQDSRSSRRSLAALCLILLAGLALRMTGIGFLLPQLSEPDGVVIDQQVHRIRGDDRLEAPPFLAAFYPTLVARIAAWMPQPEAKPAGTLTLEEHLDRASTYRRNIRIVVALLSLLAVPGTWWLARRFTSDAWALVAAALLATSVFHIWFAQQARPHAAETSFALLSVLASLRLRERGSWGAYVLLGIAAGSAIGCLQNGLAVLPACFVAVVLSVRAKSAARESARSRPADSPGVEAHAGAIHAQSPRTRAILGSLAAIGIIALAARLFYPFMFDVPERAEIGTEGSTFALSGHRIDLSMFNGRGFATVVRSVWEYDPLIAALCAVGLVLAVLDLVQRNRPRMERVQRDRLWIVLAFVVPYAIAIGLYQRTYQRFALPLVPFECAFAAYVLGRLWSRAKVSGGFVRACGLVLPALFIGLQAFAAVRLVTARARPDTIARAASWVEAHVPRDARVALMPGLDLPLLQSATARNANFPLMNDVSNPWFTYQWKLPAGEIEGRGRDLRCMPLVTEGMRTAARGDLDGFVRAQVAQWTVLEVYTPDRRALPAALRAAVAARGELVARISPDENDSGEDLPIVYQDDEYPYTTPWFARIVKARCVGPVIEIYRMR